MGVQLPQKFLEIHSVPYISSHFWSFGIIWAGDRHYVPAWTTESLLANGAWPKYLESLENEKCSLKLLENGLQGCRSNSSTGKDILESSRKRLVEIERFKQLNDWLEGAQAFEVPGDGNCGVWSLICFELGHHLVDFTQQKVVQRAEEIRHEIADFWVEVQDNHTWQQIFLKTVSTFDAAPSNTNKRDVLKAEIIKMETTPIKKRKALPELKHGETIDLCTPEKQKAVTVGACRSTLSRAASVRTRSDWKVGLVERPEDPPSLSERPEDPPSLPVEQLKRNIEDAFDGNQSSGEKQKLGDHDGSDVEQSEKRKKKRMRVRSCKSKPKTDYDYKLAAVKTYLGTLGVTWAYSQTYHSRCAVGARTKCSQFATLQEDLVNHEMPECLTCKAMLQHVGFKMEDLKIAIDDSVNPNTASPFTKKLRQMHQDLGGEINEDQAETENLPAIADGNMNEHEQADQDEVIVAVPNEEDGENESTDALERVRACIVRMHHEKFLEALPLDTLDKRIPIRCRVCQSQSQPLGKVFEGDSFATMEHFIRQHVNRAGHIASATKFVKTQQGSTCEPLPLPSQAAVPCEGFSLTHHKTHFCSELAEELVLWAKHTTLGCNLTTLRYRFELSKQELVVFHGDCHKVTTPVGDGPPICVKCSQADLPRTPLRAATRFALKHWLARILQARLLKSDEAASKLGSEFQKSVLYTANKERADELLAMGSQELQKWLRNSWMKVPLDQMTPLAVDFRDSVVKPLMQLNVLDCQSQLKQLAQSFASNIAEGDMSQMDALSLKIMKAAESGRLESNPAVMGIMLQCLEYIDKPNLKARRAMSDKERAMCQEAAILLASNGCNSSLMRTLGFSRESALRLHMSVDSLLGHGLPCPALSLLNRDHLKQNLACIDSLISRPAGIQHRQRLVLAFDFTYLLPMHSPMKLWGEPVLVGSPFCMEDLDSSTPGCMQPVANGQALKERTKANRMFFAFVSFFP